MATASPAAETFALFTGERSAQLPVQTIDFTLSTKNFELVQRAVSRNFHVLAEDSALQPAVPVISNQTTAGNFSGPLPQPLAEGLNLVQLGAGDEFDQQRMAGRRVVRDTTPPTLIVGLANDSAADCTTNSDRLTNDATITGQVTDASGIAGLFARFAGAATDSWVNITSARQDNGSFTLTPSALAAVWGTALSDGSYVLELRALDRAGNARQASLDFVLDRVVSGLEFTLAADSDTGVQGDFITSMSTVTLQGTTEAGSQLRLQTGAAASSASGTGAFTLTDVPLSIGWNTISIVATDRAGNSSPASLVVRCDEVVTTTGWMVQWGFEALEAIKADRTAPPRASRWMAMQQLAIYDTLRGIAGQPGYYTSLTAPAAVNTDVALSQASHGILIAAFPNSATRLNALRDRVLATVADGPAKSDSIAYGQSVAAAILAARSTDGATSSVSYTPKTDPGYWQPTLPGLNAALLPNWASLVPFAMTSSSQFQPAGPPSLTTAEYAETFNETYQLGGLNSSVRTADQTEIALFWADGGGTYTPPGHWQQIALQLLADRGVTPEFFASTMAKLSVALADAAIVAWNAKYEYEFWRPITAIAAADLDGNDATAADATWRPLLATPPFPEYISGHSTFSGAAAQILSEILGNNVAFTTSSVGLPGVSRSFTSFEQAANEAGRSRIYGGIHFEFSNRDGLDAGRELANFVLQRFGTLEG
ncbi:MAG: Ig-like domain-containing protein [Planctomycetota bacterium]